MTFTSAQARSVNLIAAAIAASIAGFYLFKKKFAVKNILIFSLLVGLIVWFVVQLITDGIVAASNKPPDGSIPEDFVTDGFSPIAYTNEIADALDDDYWAQFFGVDTKPYTDMNNLSDAELGMVYNDWLDRYYADFDDQTLTQALAAHNIYGNTAGAPTARTLRDQLVSRLTLNGLT